jgi:SAM-dependent methyltransferase
MFATNDKTITNMKEVTDIQKTGIIDTEKEQKFWDYFAMKYRAGDIDPNSNIGRLAPLIGKEFSLLPVKNPRIVEIACSTGWLAQKVAGHGSSYLGLDISPQSIEIAQRRVPDARFVAVDFLKWDPQGERFDVALFIDSISSFRDQEAALAKVYEMLDRGGYLLLTNTNPVVYSRISWVWPVAEGQVRKWLSRARLEAMLKGAGFRLVKFYTALPDGDRGFLRILNSAKLNRLVGTVIPPAWIRKAKELCGLGQYFIVVAQRVK